MFAEVEDDEEEGEEREEGEKESYAKAKEEFGVGANPAAVMSAMRYAMKRMAKRYAKMTQEEYNEWQEILAGCTTVAQVDARWQIWKKHIGL